MPDATSVLLDGPWRHRDYSVNGIRLHVAEAGDGPLILLLHGFPEFWWSWRHQLPALARAGYRVVAPDLRGYGASDKPPRGYDSSTLAGDIAGLVRALGERDAMVVGHGWGATLAWTMGAAHPQVVRRLAILGMAHPRRLRTALLRSGGQLAASGYALGFQLPRYPEFLLTRAGGREVERLMRLWSGPTWRASDDFAAAVARYRSAMQIPQAAYGAMEYFRWTMRSLPRADGLRYTRAMATPIVAPTLQIHGSLDQCVLPSAAVGSGRYVTGPYRWRVVDGVGHFPHEESPEAITALLVDWASE